MKTINHIVVSFGIIAALVSCEKLEIVEESGHSFTREICVSISQPTKTTVDGLKTYWEEGDTLLISNGFVDSLLCVSPEFVGANSLRFTTDLDGDIYICYPAKYFSSFNSVNIPSFQSGEFGDADVLAAKVPEDNANVYLTRLVAIAKITAAPGSGEMSGICLTARPGNALSGSCGVQYGESGAVSLVPSACASSITVTCDAERDVYYAGMIPGTFDAGFSMMAVSSGMSYQYISTNSSQTVMADDLLDFGNTGGQMNDLLGDGSESNPWQIRALPEWLAFAYYVNTGHDMEGEYVKVTNPISGITVPAGAYNGSENEIVYFKGVFDGNNQPLTLDMSGNGYQALIGALGPGGQVKNVKVSGTVYSSAEYAAGVVAYVEADTVATVIENCVNDVVVHGSTNVGGVVGYTNAVVANNDDGDDIYKLEIRNCRNNAAITAQHTVGGIAGYATGAAVSDCDNAGAITATVASGTIMTLHTNAYRYADLDGNRSANEAAVRRANGGVAGVLHNSTVKDSKNTAAVNAVSKAGGVAGCLYWSTVANCENSGAVTVTEDLAGGLAGIIWQSGTVSKCLNTATVTARGAVGGMLGMASAYERSSNAYLTVTESVNEGEVVSNGKTSTSEYNYGMGSLSAAGGIVGAVKHFNKDWTNVTSCVNKGNVTGEGQAVGGIVGYQGCPRNGADWGAIDKCVNEGNVTSKLYRAGGILGASLSRFTTARYTIRNCVNKGTVSAPIVAAGIAGWMRVAYPAASAPGFQKIHNCLNTGDVIFTTTDSTQVVKAYAGGTIGFSVENELYNCVSTGEIKGVHGTDLDVSGFVGTLYGQLDQWSKVAYGFAAYLEDSNFNGKTVGANTTIANLAMFDEGQLDVPVTVDGSEYEAVLDALNAWVVLTNGEGSTYVEWVEGEKCPEPKLEEGE